MTDSDDELRLALLESAVRVLIGLAGSRDPAARIAFHQFPDDMAKVFGAAAYEPRKIKEMAKYLTYLTPPGAPEDC